MCRHFQTSPRALGPYQTMPMRMGHTRSLGIPGSHSMAFEKRSISAPPSICNAKQVTSFARLGPIPAKAPPPLPVSSLCEAKPYRRAMLVKCELSDELVTLSSGQAMSLAIEFVHTFHQVEHAICHQLGHPVKILSRVAVHERDRFWSLCVAQGVTEIRIVKQPSDSRFTI